MSVAAPATTATAAAAEAAQAVAELQARIRPGRRFMLGLVGAPGSGKSTLAQLMGATLGEAARLVPMDGYHLAQCELARLGRAQRKGAPDTFDAHGYVALLRRLRTQVAPEVVYAPEFRRDMEEPVAGAIAVPPDVCVVTEGNYLLLNEPGWCDVRPLLDEVWYVEADEALRVQRLIARHTQFGRSPQQAHDWVMQSDEPNARRIEATRSRADRVFRWGEGFVA